MRNVGQLGGLPVIPLTPAYGGTGTATGSVTGTAGSTLTLTSAQVDGTTTPFKFVTTNAVTSGNPILEVYNTTTLNLQATVNGSTVSLFFYNGATVEGGFISNSTPSLQLYNYSAFFPFSTNACDFGANSNRWLSVWARSYYGTQQAGGTSGAVSINPALGDTIRIAATANITGLTVTDGTEGQKITLYLVQNAAGSATWVSAITNVRLAGGTFTKTTTANAIDTLSLRWDTSTTDWLETGRTLNLS